MVLPPFSMIFAPTPVEPVNEIMSTFLVSTSAAGTSGPAPFTMLTTPGGKPAASIASPSRKMPSGSCGAGLITVVQPAASAGAILPATLVTGKL